MYLFTCIDYRILSIDWLVFNANFSSISTISWRYRISTKNIFYNV